MVSDQAYNVWLVNSAPSDRCLLVELDHQAGTVYLASQPYQTSPSDDLPNQPYDDLLVDMPELLQDQALVDLGDLSFIADDNANEYMQWHWRGREARLFIGSTDWAKSDFRQLATALIEQVTRPSVDRIKVEFADYGILLTQKICTNKHGNILLPVCVGHVLNVKPVLLDSLELVYAVHDGPVYEIVVRDNGVVVDSVNDLGLGRFSLLNSPVGEITAEVRQFENNDLLSLNQYIIDRLGIGSVHPVHLLDQHISYDMGYYAVGDVDYLAVLKSINQSLGCVSRFNVLGQYELVFVDYQRPADYEIGIDDIVEEGIEIVEEWSELDRLIITYKPNDTVMNNLAGIAYENGDAEFLESEYLALELENEASNVPDLWTIEEQKKTRLINKEQVQAELERIANFRFRKHFVYKMDVFVKGVHLLVGDRALVSHTAWGLSDVGTILKSERQPASNRISIEVLI